MSGEESEKAKGGGGGGGGEYGTFQGLPSYPPPRPVMGFPQPVPPPGLSGQPPAEPYSHPRGYQAVHGYEVGVHEQAHVHDRLPCCGCGIGWFLFIIGFFLAAIPWYVGAFLLIFSRVDYREKPGYVACTIAAVLATIAAIIGASSGAHVW